MHSERIILLEPPMAGAITGGYRFNEILAGALPEVRRVTAAPCRLGRAVARVNAIEGRRSGVLLVDSLYLRRPCSCGELRRLKRAGYRLVLLAHLLASQEHSPRLGARRERLALAAFDGAIAPSTFMAHALAARGVPAHATVTVHPTAPGAPTPRAPDAGSPSATPHDGAGHGPPAVPHTGVPRLLSVANATPVKHLHSAIPALATLRDYPWEWEIIGKRSDSRYVSRIRRLAAMYGVGHRIRFRGVRSPTQVSEAIPRATALLVTSRFESFGIVAHDAVQAGVPVVAWRVGGIAEAVGSAEHRATAGLQTATLLELNDNEGLARTLKGLLAGATEER